MKNASEIDRRVRGTEYASMLDPKVAPQRSGVLATMNNKADTIRLLRTDKETAPRWTAREWEKAPGLDFSHQHAGDTRRVETNYQPVAGPADPAAAA